MKHNFLEVGVLAIILVLLYVKPPVLTQLSTTLVGKILMITLIICAAQKSLLISIFIAVMFVFFLDDGYEGMTDGDTDTDTDTDKKSSRQTDIREKYCKEGSLVDSSGNPIDVDSLDCNPCDDTCDFDVKTVNDLLGIDESMRPKNSH